MCKQCNKVVDAIPHDVMSKLIEFDERINALIAEFVPTLTEEIGIAISNTETGDITEDIRDSVDVSEDVQTQADSILRVMTMSYLGGWFASAQWNHISIEGMTEDESKEAELVNSQSFTTLAYRGFEKGYHENHAYKHREIGPLN